jgi:hypothetical protein
MSHDEIAQAVAAERDRLYREIWDAWMNATSSESHDPSFGDGVSLALKVIGEPEGFQA